MTNKEINKLLWKGFAISINWKNNLQVAGMIQYSNATGRASDLNKLMIKQLNDALEPDQPECYTQAMFKLTALLISIRGNWDTLLFLYAAK